MTGLRHHSSAGVPKADAIAYPEVGTRPGLPLAPVVLAPLVGNEAEGVDPELTKRLHYYDDEIVTVWR